MELNNTQIDSAFGIPGISQDSFFSQYTWVICNGELLEIGETVGDTTYFDPLSNKNDRWERAEGNMLFFLGRSEEINNPVNKDILIN
jgi:hypothetical protein